LRPFLCAALQKSATGNDVGLWKCDGLGYMCHLETRNSDAQNLYETIAIAEYDGDSSWVQILQAEGSLQQAQAADTIVQAERKQVCPLPELVLSQNKPSKELSLIGEDSSTESLVSEAPLESLFSESSFSDMSIPSEDPQILLVTVRGRSFSDVTCIHQPSFGNKQAKRPPGVPPLPLWRLSQKTSTDAFFEVSPSDRSNLDHDDSYTESGSSFVSSELSLPDFPNMLENPELGNLTAGGCSSRPLHNVELHLPTLLESISELQKSREHEKKMMTASRQVFRV